MGDRMRRATYDTRSTSMSTEDSASFGISRYLQRYFNRAGDCAAVQPHNSRACARTAPARRALGAGTTSTTSFVESSPVEIPTPLEMLGVMWRWPISQSCARPACGAWAERSASKTCRAVSGHRRVWGCGAAHRRRPVASAMHTVAQDLLLLRHTLFVGRNRSPSIPAAAPRFSRPNARPSAATFTWCSSGRESGLLVSAGFPLGLIRIGGHLPKGG